MLQIRRLICSCLSKLYTHGDMISIYSRITTLQQFLAGKDSSGRSVTDVSRGGSSVTDVSRGGSSVTDVSRGGSHVLGAGHMLGGGGGRS